MAKKKRKNEDHINMGKKESKPAEPPPMEESDDRWELSRNFGPKIQEFNAKLDEIYSKPLDQLLPRPVHSSGYFRELPQYQAWIMHIAFFAVIMRKLPLANPAGRVIFWLLGVDLIRKRIQWISPISDDEINQAKCFDRIYHQLRFRYGLRMPDFRDEYEDWYNMNKPGYRVAIPHEYGMDSWMRFIALNYRTYKLRPVKWEGKWEQEMCLNMDLHAPHSDHWLDIH